MRMRNQILENSMFSIYQNPDFLPPLWRVIYQEAIRGHHVLFDHIPQSSYGARTLTLGRPGAQSGLSENILETIADIIKSSSITEMKEIINKLSRQEREVLFFIYQRAIRQWQNKLKSTLN